MLFMQALAGPLVSNFSYRVDLLQMPVWKGFGSDSIWAKALCLFEFSFSMSSGNVLQSSHFSHFPPMQTLNIIPPGVYHSCFGNEDSTKVSSTYE